MRVESNQLLEGKLLRYSVICIDIYLRIHIFSFKNSSLVTPDKITPKKPKRRSLLETVQQKNLFRRRESPEDMNSSHMNSFKADMFKENGNN